MAKSLSQDAASILKILATDVVAASEALLGTILVRGERSARIIETEAYRAADDPASHAHRGPTTRNTIMFGSPGLSYVYFSYGAHWMLNVVSLPVGLAGGILIRAAEPLTGVDEMRARRPRARKDEDLLSGPGKLSPAFDITFADYGVHLFAKYRVSPPDARPDPEGIPPLRIEMGHAPRKVLRGPRIGIAEGKGHETPWRFIDADAVRWASRGI